MSSDVVRIAAALSRISALDPDIAVECRTETPGGYRSVLAYTADGTFTVGMGATQVEAFEDAAEWVEHEAEENEERRSWLAEFYRGLEDEESCPFEDDPSDLLTRPIACSRPSTCPRPITCSYVVSPDDDLPLVAYREQSYGSRAVHV